MKKKTCEDFVCRGMEMEGADHYCTEHRMRTGGPAQKGGQEASFYYSLLP